MSREFLPGVDSYGEFRSRLKDAEEAEKISKKNKSLDPDYLPEEDGNNFEEDIENEDED